MEGVGRGVADLELESDLDDVEGGDDEAVWRRVVLTSYAGCRGNARRLCSSAKGCMGEGRCHVGWVGRCLSPHHQGKNAVGASQRNLRSVRTAILIPRRPLPWRHVVSMPVSGTVSL